MMSRLSELLPLPLRRSIARWHPARRTRRGGRYPYGREQEPEFYDRSFHHNESWSRHYTASPYYPLWTVVGDRIRRAAAQSVLDIGCGSGQVAAMLRDNGLRSYCGLDFSPARLARARAVCPAFEFIEANIFTSDILEARSYDFVIALEFLEHVERDLDVLRRLKPGVTVLSTVPNFPGTAHVRHFRDADEVELRYSSMFDEFEVFPIPADVNGKTFFLFQGRR